MAGIWTEEREQAARTLFNVGASASEMAAALSKEFGFAVTRNAIIGLWNRRGWTGTRVVLPKKRQVTVEKHKARRKLGAGNVPGVTRSDKVQYIRIKAADVVPLHIGFADLTPDTCRYPYGEGPFTFCGCPSLPSQPYCEPHTLLCGPANVEPAETRGAMEKRKREYQRAFRAEAVA